MPKRAAKPNYRLRIRKRMQTLGTYKEEYEGAIEILAQLQEQYDELTRQFRESGYCYMEQSARGTKKATIVTTLESLRKDVLAYMSALGLTPRDAKKLDVTQRAEAADPFAAALAKLGSDSS